MASSESIFFIICSAMLLHWSMARSIETCILTESTCQCSSTAPSGKCIHSHGDGECFFDTCSEGYRCDCIGYELCSISKCGKHITLPGARTTETSTFPCEFSEQSGTCTWPVQVLDSINAAYNAVTDATASDDEATEDEGHATDIIADLQKRKMDVLEVLKDVEKYSDHMQEDAVLEINAEAELVESAVVEAALILVKTSKQAKKASEAKREVRRMKREANNAETLTLANEEMLRKETKMGCQDEEKCKELHAGILELLEKRKILCRGAGKKAKEGRRFAKNCNEMMKKVEERRVDSKKAYNRYMQKAFHVLGFAKGLHPNHGTEVHATIGSLR